MGFEASHSFLAKELKQNALTVRSRGHISNLSNGIYVDTQFSDITTVQKIIKEQLNFEYRMYVYS